MPILVNVDDECRQSPLAVAAGFAHLSPLAFQHKKANWPSGGHVRCPCPVKISSLAPSWPWAPARNCRASRVAARNPAMTSCWCFAAHLLHFCGLRSLAPVIWRAGSLGEIHNDSSVAFDMAVGFALAGVPCTATSHFCPVVSAGALPPRSSSCFTKLRHKRCPSSVTSSASRYE